MGCNMMLMCEYECECGMEFELTLPSGEPKTTLHHVAGVAIPRLQIRRYATRHRIALYHARESYPNRPNNSYNSNHPHVYLS